MPGIRPGPRDTDFERPEVADPGASDYYSTLVYDSLYHSPVGTLGIGGGPKGSIQRMSELSLEKGDDSTPKLSAQEATSTYGLDGQLTFDEPIQESAAALMHQRKLAEIRRDYILASGVEDHWSRHISGFGVSMAASLLDPVNLASMFIPVVGESRAFQGVERATRFLDRGLISSKQLAKVIGTDPLAYRAAKGGLEGLVGMGMVEPINLAASLQEKAQYGWEDSAKNLAAGLVLGAGLHSLGGMIHDKFSAVHSALDPRQLQRKYKGEDITWDKVKGPDFNPENWHVTVQGEQEGIKGSGYVQLDEVMDGTNVRSASKETLAKEGITIPDFSGLPTGKYTLKEAVDFLVKHGEQEPSIDPQTHEAATLSAVADVVQDKPVSSPGEVVKMDPNLDKIGHKEIITTDTIDNFLKHQGTKFDKPDSFYAPNLDTDLENETYKKLVDLGLEPHKFEPYPESPTGTGGKTTYSQEIFPLMQGLSMWGDSPEDIVFEKFGTLVGHEKLVKDIKKVLKEGGIKIKRPSKELKAELAAQKLKELQAKAKEPSPPEPTPEKPADPIPETPKPVEPITKESRAEVHAKLEADIQAFEEVISNTTPPEPRAEVKDLLRQEGLNPQLAADLLAGKVTTEEVVRQQMRSGGIEIPEAEVNKNLKPGEITTNDRSEWEKAVRRTEGVKIVRDEGFNDNDLVSEGDLVAMVGDKQIGHWILAKHQGTATVEKMSHTDAVREAMRSAIDRLNGILEKNKGLSDAETKEVGAASDRIVEAKLSEEALNAGINCIKGKIV